MRWLFRFLALMALVPLVALPTAWAAEQRWQPLPWEKDFQGWRTIQKALADGKGEEFVRAFSGLKANTFMGENEFQAVVKTAQWVAAHAKARKIPSPPGIVFGEANVMYDEISTSVFLSGVAPLTEANFAILLCSLLRHHTYGGLTPDRVFVAVAFQPDPHRKHRVTVHKAWVLYRSPDQKWWHILPQYGENQYPGEPPKGFTTELPLKEKDREKTVLVYFNDKVVKGGQDLLQPAAEGEKEE